jgi:hypothetical protein
MTRLIEIVLFLTPFIGFAAWRVVAPADRMPGWVIALAVGAVMMILALLLVLRALDASDGNKTYVPAHMEDGRVIPGHAAP